MNTLERVVKAILACKENPGELTVTIESNLREDLDIDSLDILMLVGELEEEFDISINEDDFEDVVTVADIVAKLEAHL